MTSALRITLIAAQIFSLPCFTCAATIFESAALGPDGFTIEQIRSREIPGINVNQEIFQGARFQLHDVSIITHIGGHFVSNEDDEGKTIFGAIVPLLGSSSFPVLSRDDFSSALGATKVVLPGRSADVFGELALRLDPGWYAVVFGSGLFGADSYGGSALRTNRDVGVPNRITSQPGYGWLNMSDVLPSFVNYRFVVQGVAIPEPSTSILLAVVACACFVFRRGVVLACARVGVRISLKYQIARRLP